eukprot:CAMPEP_0169385128 /NCGR_PEP_ID=MMETSP1017-20121227/43893_1 /TAXON_ID=342587 /ORGANISM="Karlodinium micrum, Strain CCMP2283" /LENGTH=285 /DNA_ID=CAMNT_0009485927 /DNA_START=176 /DNA_END=1031 /DNA_ORIENTATION=-
MSFNNTLTHGPTACIALTTCGCVGTNPVHLAIFPLSSIATAIWPMENSVAMLNILHVFAIVRGTVAPEEHAPPMHLVFLPLTLELAAIRPVVHANALDEVVKKLALIPRAIGPIESAMATLDAALMLALIHCSIRPSFTTLAMLAVILPLAIVLGAIHAGVRSMSVGFIVLPRPIIEVPCAIEESSRTLRTVCHPLAIVFCTIRPNLHAKPSRRLPTHSPVYFAPFAKVNSGLSSRKSPSLIVALGLSSADQQYVAVVEPENSSVATTSKRVMSFSSADGLAAGG